MWLDLVNAIESTHHASVLLLRMKVRGRFWSPKTDGVIQFNSCQVLQLFVQHSSGKYEHVMSTRVISSNLQPLPEADLAAPTRMPVAAVASPCYVDVISLHHWPEHAHMLQFFLSIDLSTPLQKIHLLTTEWTTIIRGVRRWGLQIRSTTCTQGRRTMCTPTAEFSLSGPTQRNYVFTSRNLARTHRLYPLVNIRSSKNWFPNHVSVVHGSS